MKLENKVDKNFNGCILVTMKGEILLQKSYGFSDLSNKTPNELDTKFATASAGKVFIAVGILQLIESGKLGFSTTIGEILDLDLKAIDKNITIEQLLCHTSGIPDYFDESIMDEYDELWRDFPNYKIRTSNDLLPLFIDKPMMYAAGERFQYNNTGYVVLGLVIEKVTGQLFDEYLKKNIFIPSGMLDTGYYELDRLPARCANSYIYDEKRKEYYTNIYSVDVKGTGAGGAFTTVLDIDKFWINLFAGNLISIDMVQEMLTVHSHDDSSYYGYGVWLDKSENGIFTPHFEGCDPGVAFMSSYDQEKDLCITAISNFGCNVWKLRRNILKEIH